MAPPSAAAALCAAALAVLGGSVKAAGAGAGPGAAGRTGAARPVPAAERVYLRFDGPWPARVIGLVESDLRTALGRRHVEVRVDARADRGDGARRPARRALRLTLAAASEALERVTVTLESEGIPALIRRLDLDRFPPDGRVLALVVAADELFQAAREPAAAPEAVAAPAPSPVEPVRDAPAAAERRSSEAPAPATAAAPPQAPQAPAPTAPPPPAPAPTPPAVTPPAAGLRPPLPEEPTPTPAPTLTPTPTPAATIQGGGPPVTDSEPARSLAVTFAFDSYAGGQTQLGPEVAFRGRLGGRLLAVVAVAGRQGLTFAAPTGSVTSRLLGARLALGLQLLRGGRYLALACDAGARAAALWFEGHPTSGAVTEGHRVSTAVAYADAICALDVVVARAAALRASAGGGLPILAQTAADGAGAATGASGLLLEAQVGLVLLF